MAANSNNVVLVGQAKMIVDDYNGKIVKKMDVPSNGNGTNGQVLTSLGDGTSQWKDMSSLKLADWNMAKAALMF